MRQILKPLGDDLKSMMFSLNCMQLELFCVECFKCPYVHWSTSEEAFTILDVRKHQIRKTWLVTIVPKPPLLLFKDRNTGQLRSQEVVLGPAESDHICISDPVLPS